MNSNVKYACIFLWLLGMIPRPVFAQDRWFEATAGMAVSVPAAKGSPWRYKPRVLPHAGISAFFSFNKTFALKTGALYQMKGMITDAQYVPDSIYAKELFTTKTDYHFISIPLQLAVSFGAHSQDVCRIAGGMNYGFLAAANSKITIDSYYDEQTKTGKTFSYSHLIAAQPKNDIDGLPQHEGTAMYFFVPSLRFDFTYQWQERIILSAFYEYDLQDIRMRTVGRSRVNLHYAGISVGVKFW